MSKRSKACEISQKTKQIVWDRDNHKCIYCGKYVPKSCANAHFIKRSQGGLGIPENVVALCPKCHYEEDHGQNTKDYENYIEEYLKNYYGNTWNKENLIYKKYN
jgi:5-methylcytosine-specific restriction endonuclease McrA